MSRDSLRGRLLVATPGLRDPNFDHTVALVLEHGDEGALGLVINRPSGVAVTDPLPEWHDLAARPAVVFAGGPVAAGTVICLARAGADEEVTGWTPLFAGLGTVDVGRHPLDVGAAVEEIRVFSGYAGWSPGQLEGEIEVGGWWVVDADPHDPFCPEPAELWRDVLRRQRASLAVFAHCPRDPSTN